MNLKRILVMGAAIASLVASTALAADAKTITIKMTALNGSGENGTATLTDVPAGLQVVVSLKGGPKDTPQPTHIHVGTCGNINKAPEYPLSNTVDGQSSTVVKGVHLSTLTGAKYAINVHKSASELGVYVSCGDIKA
jgi:opacity protein-like surface antigen